MTEAAKCFATKTEINNALDLENKNREKMKKL